MFSRNIHQTFSNRERAGGTSFFSQRVTELIISCSHAVIGYTRKMDTQGIEIEKSRTMQCQQKLVKHE